MGMQGIFAKFRSISMAAFESCFALVPLSGRMLVLGIGLLGKDMLWSLNVPVLTISAVTDISTWSSFHRPDP